MFATFFEDQSEESRLIGCKKVSYSIQDSCSVDIILTTKKPVLANNWFAVNKILWLFSFVIFFLLLIYAVSTSTNGQSNYTSLSLLTGSKIHLSSLKYSRYIRIESNRVKVSESVPWTHGSTFEVHNADSGCFQLRTSSNTWLSVDKSNGEIVADATTRYLASSFMAVPFAYDSNEIAPNQSAVNRYSLSQTIQLRLCETDDQWLHVRQHSLSSSSRTDNAEEAIPTDSNRILSAAGSDYVLKLMVEHQSTESSAVTPSPLLVAATTALTLIVAPFNQIFGSISSTAGDNTIVRSQNFTFDENASAKFHPLSSLFQLSVLEPLHGVNLGGWFIPEVWMAPAMFADTGLGWGGSLCRLETALI
jgi:hypothetical protein